jgi:ABC-2 type transport system ATP-binding protein
MLVVDTRNLRKEYGRLTAVDDVNLQIERGQVVGLVGPNGAGKTTLLKMLATLLPPTSGQLSLLGMDVTPPYQAVRKQLGYMPDFFNLYDGVTLDECVRFFGRCYGVPEAELGVRVGEALEYVGLTEKRFEEIQHLSRGMTQRLGIANLLVHDPALIILDEPASGLDPEARIQLRDVLKRLARDGKTIVISSHILSELEELCSHICAMHRGSVVAQGSIEAIRQSLSASKLRVRLVEGATFAADIALAVPGVSAAEIQGGDLLVEMSGGARAHALLNETLVKAGLQVSGLNEEKLGLEALFLEIVEKARQRP